MTTLLGVNVDHVATLRQQRGTLYPDPVQAALQAELAGADGITVHLREDRRHIQDHDVERLRAVLTSHLNLEMAATQEMVAFACRIKPDYCCIVPEKRTELTTEGGLDVLGNEAALKTACYRLTAAGIQVSLFVEPDPAQIDAAVRCGAPLIEIHTGRYADAPADVVDDELQRIISATAHAQQRGLTVNAGHGLHYHNVHAIAAIAGMHELNIGHAIVARAIFSGMEQAVRDMKGLLELQ